MTRRLAIAIALCAAPGSAIAQDTGLDGRQPAGRAAPPRSLNANPSALIAAEIALGRLAAEKGLWFALRQTAAPGARLMRPDPVDAGQWLRSRTEPAVAPLWAGQAVWMSCDGTIGVVKGKWSREGQTGRFASVWQRQEKGDYKWLLRQDEPGTSSAPPLDDMLSAMTADCPPRPERRLIPDAQRSRQKSRRAAARPAPVDALAGHSPDRSLHWRSGQDASGARWLLVQLAKGGTMTTVLGAELEALPPG